ncbi:MAG: GTP 3',8-cyclase MoaA [Ignavibacteria bacterium]|nr:GTP 3',8-cyclase MoaA [Ignavibacteria bacterium]
MPLVDLFGRNHEYLRVSVTDRCNLHCRYCVPSEGIKVQRREEILSFEEIELLARIFVTLGIKKIRITGGEPLLRDGLETLCASLSSIVGLRSLALTTNGVLLTEKSSALKHSGIQQLNISLDTLQQRRFEHVTKRASFNEVLRGIESAILAGFEEVKINTVVMRNFNDDELLDFVAFAKSLSLNVRFIEFMPFLGNGWNHGRFVSFLEMKQIIETQFTLVPKWNEQILPGPAKEFSVDNSNATIGFITTMSDHFCSDCNRLRISAMGIIRNCLFAQSGIDVKTPLRNGATMNELEMLIRSSVLSKWEKHPEEHELVQLQQQSMIGIGG